MDNYAQLTQILTDKQIPHELLEITTGTLSIDDTVKSLGIKYREGMSTLVYRVRGRDFVALLRRDDRNVDLDALKKLLGTSRVSFASAEDLQGVGFEPGLVAPLLVQTRTYESHDEKLPIKVYVDSKVLEMTKVVCGTSSATVALQIQKDNLL